MLVVYYIMLGVRCQGNFPAKALRRQVRINHDGSTDSPLWFDPFDRLRAGRLITLVREGQPVASIGRVRGAGGEEGELGTMLKWAPKTGGCGEWLFSFNRHLRNSSNSFRVRPHLIKSRGIAARTVFFEFNVVA